MVAAFQIFKSRQHIEVVLDSSGWSHMDSGYKCLGSIAQCVRFVMQSMKFVFVDCCFSLRLSFRVVCPEVAVTLSTAFKIREKARRSG